MTHVHRFEDAVASGQAEIIGADEGSIGRKKAPAKHG